MVGVAVGQEDDVGFGEAPPEGEVDAFSRVEHRANVGHVEPGGEKRFGIAADEHGEENGV